MHRHSTKMAHRSRSARESCVPVGPSIHVPIEPRHPSLKAVSQCEFPQARKEGRWSASSPSSILVLDRLDEHEEGDDAFVGKKVCRHVREWTHIPTSVHYQTAPRRSASEHHRGAWLLQESFPCAAVVDYAILPVGLEPTTYGS